MVVLFTETRCVTFYHLELGNVGEENKLKVFGSEVAGRRPHMFVFMFMNCF